MYNYNYAYYPNNVHYYIDGERIPGPGGSQWDGHGGGHGGGHWEHGQWIPRCRRVWVPGFGWTWICRW
ncbi:hypothetical protein [Peribacillus simplex]|uniref:hypothetical protein n=1 Tax=Peribacillus simplex TaxID=1478 RepID=UPI0036723BE9